LFSSEDKSLLICRDAFLLLDQGMQVFDLGFFEVHFECKGFASEGFDKNLL
jgi:hypothetical protein